MEESVDYKNEEPKDTTNWKGWYWGLMIFLAAQIALYLVITNYYAA